MSGTKQESSLRPTVLEPGKTYTVEFLDWGQDFLRWDIKDGRVIDADLQAWFWNGTAVHNKTIMPGVFLSITCARGNPELKQSFLKYPVIKISVKE